MNATNYYPTRSFANPPSWRGSEIANDNSWCWKISPTEHELLKRTLAFLCPDPIGDCGRIDDGRLPDQFKSILRSVLEELEYGRGFILVTGLPIEDVQQAEWILCAFAGEIGIPVSQNQRGDFIGRVEDKGADITKATARGYQSSASLPFHSDRADLTALLCVRAAECGGETFLVSAVAAMEELASSSPDLLEILEKPFPHDQRGEQRPGQGPWTMHPVFVRDRNTFLARYIRRFIDASQRHIGAPSLTVRQYQALDALDGVLNRHDLPITVRLQPGDLLLMNNHLIFHGRTVFQDSVIPGNGRLLFRIWLASHLGRPLPPSFEEVFGSTESGDVRGGVWPPDTNVSAIYKRLSKT